MMSWALGMFWLMCQELIEAIMMSLVPLTTSVGWAISRR
jgi:hypothetical protein